MQGRVRDVRLSEWQCGQHPLAGLRHRRRHLGAWGTYPKLVTVPAKLGTALNDRTVQPLDA